MKTVIKLFRLLSKPTPKFKVGQSIRPKWWKATTWTDRNIVREVEVLWQEYECSECGAVHQIGWKIRYGFKNGDLYEDNHDEWECAA